MLVRVVAVQAKIGEELTLEEKIYIFKQHPDFVCLPEYALIGDDIEDFSRAALRKTDQLEYYEKLSDQLSTCLIGGSVVEAYDDKLFNSSYIFENGNQIGKYRKRKPVEGELSNGIFTGNEPLILEVAGVRIAILICGDVFSPELYEELAIYDVDLIFVPTTSPYRPHDSLSQKLYRDNKYFVQGAALANSYVIKTCAVGKLFGKPLQGRSLIAAPWGIQKRSDKRDEMEKRIISCTLDIDDLREFRSKRKNSFPIMVDSSEHNSIH